MRNQGTGSLKDEIENEIITGRFPPGERLDEVSLAERYGVSRTPIREALHALAASGLLEVRPHRGTIVAEVSPERLFEMFEVMAEMEAMCARHAARRMTEAEHRELEAAHAACGAAEQKAIPTAITTTTSGFISASTKAATTASSPTSARPCIAGCSRIAACSCACATA